MNLTWRLRLRKVIFESDTQAGRVFDIALFWAILASMATVMLDSVASVRESYGTIIGVVEWFFTILFTIEYMLRLYSAPIRLRYATGFFGVVDLLSVLPTYLDFVFGGLQSLLILRVFRLLRIFRVFRLGKHMGEARTLVTALEKSVPKITVFLSTVLSIVLVVGALMYLLEGEANGFTSIPRSIYWAIVTMTTVGYGDISPKTAIGQVVASVLMILGYGIMAVPTGIVAAELTHETRHASAGAICGECGTAGHDPGARFCKNCGGELAEGTI